MAGLVPAISIIGAPCLPDRDHRVKPSDDVCRLDIRFQPCDRTAITCGFSVARSSRNCMRTLGSESCDRRDRARGPRRRRWTAHLPRARRSAALFRLDLPKVLSLSQRVQHRRPIGSQAMDMWTTQERCPHAHSLNNKYKSQTKVESAKD